MRPRGLLLILLAGLILAIGAAGTAQRDNGKGGSRTSVPAQPAPVTPANPGGVEAGVVTATLPADRVVHAKVGEEIELRVTSQSADIARITELAVRAPVGPDITGPIRFGALEPGRFAVHLDVAGTIIGYVDVTGDEGAG